MWYALGYLAFCLVIALGLGRLVRAGSAASVCTGNCNQGRACDCCDDLAPAQGLAHCAGHNEAWLEEAYMEFLDTPAVDDEGETFKRLMREYATKCVREALSQVRACL